VEEQAILKTAKAKANEIISIAESKAAELKKAANEYADDALRRTESAIAEALDEVRQSRVRFRSISSSAPARQTEHE
jgi:cell division septum initiation protein DivIVA